MDKKTIKCCDCGEEEEFWDDGVTVDCMPDGYILPNGEWVCADCGHKRNLD